jgi:hypothetical protein
VGSGVGVKVGTGVTVGTGVEVGIAVGVAPHAITLSITARQDNRDNLFMAAS